jgi:hypothetical protein
MIRLQQIARISGFILLLGFGLGSAALLMLPGLIETRILPRIAKQTGLSSLICPINRLGFSQISAGPLTLGAATDPDLTIEHVSLTYSPTSLRKRELKKVTLSGVNIKTVFSKGSLTITGLEKVIKQNASSPSTYEIPTLPFAELEIKRSVIRAEANGGKFRIPFSLQLKKSTTAKPETTILHGTLRLYPRNQPVTLKFTANFNENEGIHLSLQVPKVDLPNFRVSDIDISIKNNLNNTSLQGHGTTLLAGRDNDFIWSKPLHQKWHLEANLDPHGEWQASLNSPNDGSFWELQKEDLTISGNSPTITIKARGRGKSITSSAHLEFAKTHIKNQSFNLKLADLKLRTELLYQDSTGPAIDATLQFSDGTLQASDYGLQVLGIAGTLPLRWPTNQATTERQGKLDCRKILLEELDLGRFAASLHQEEEKILFEGCYESALVAGVKMITEGQCGLDQNGSLQAAANFEIPACKPKNPLILGDFFSSADTSIIDVTLSA